MVGDSKKKNKHAFLMTLWTMALIMTVDAFVLPAGFHPVTPLRTHNKHHPALSTPVPLTSLVPSSPFISQIFAPTATTKRRSISRCTLTAVPAPKVTMAMPSNNVLRGKWILLTSKFWVSPMVYKEALQRIIVATYWPEVAIIAAMSNSVGIAQWIYLRKWKAKLAKFHNRHGSKPRTAEGSHDRDDNESGISTTSPVVAEEAQQQESSDTQVEAAILKRFRSSKTSTLARIIQQVGYLQALWYLSDVSLVFLELMKFQFVVRYQAPQIAGSIIFSTWLAYNLSQLKYYYLRHGVGSLSLKNIRQRKQLSDTMDGINGDGNNTSPPPMGVYNRFANRVMDVIIYFCAFSTVVDLLGIQVGFAIKSIFGLGSFGTLVLSLASKDVAAEFVGGLMVQSSNFIDEGETVILQDGTTGTVLKIGWLDTYIQKSDDCVVRVPNSQISHQRIARPKRQPLGYNKRKR